MTSPADLDRAAERADLCAALAYLNHEAKRIPLHWADDKAKIHGHINAVLDDLDVMAAEDAEVS